METTAKHLLWEARHRGRCLIPWREKAHFCNCHAMRGEDSRWQMQRTGGILVFRWASNLMGSAISNELPGSRRQFAWKAKPGDEMMFPVKSARPRPEVPSFPSAFSPQSLCLNNSKMTGVVCSSCLWIKTVLFDFVIEGDREESRWVSWTDYYFCWVVFDLIYECVHMNVDSLREALTIISVPRQRWSSQLSSNCQKRKEIPKKFLFWV